jgi:hypothetical protein
LREEWKSLQDLVLKTLGKAEGGFAPLQSTITIVHAALRRPVVLGRGAALLAPVKWKRHLRGVCHSEA